MVQTAYPVHLANPRGNSFHCRFCAVEINSYVGVLFHELNVHAPHFSCRGCEIFLDKLSSHFVRDHGEPVDADEVREWSDEGKSETSVKRVHSDEEVDPLDDTTRSPEERLPDDQPLTISAIDASLCTVEQGWSPPPSPIQEVDVFQDEVPFPAEEIEVQSEEVSYFPSWDDAETVPGVSLSLSTVGFYSQPDERMQNVSSKPGKKRKRIVVKRKDSTQSGGVEPVEEDSEEDDPRLPVFRVTNPKRNRTIPLGRVIAIEERIDETIEELDKGISSEFAPFRRDDDAEKEIQYCEDFMDVVGNGPSDRVDDPMPTMEATFVVKVLNGLQCPGFRREQQKPGGRRDPCICPQCALPFARETALMMHLYRIHGDDSTKAFKCKKCDKNYSNRSFLVRHCAWMSVGKKLKCKLWRCDEHFATSVERSKHVLEVHGGIACRFCDKKFVNYPPWRLHMDKVHVESEEAMTCRICDREKFTEVADLKNHEIGCRKGVNRTHRPERGSIGEPRKKDTPADRDRQKQARQRSKENLQKCSICCFLCFEMANREKHERTCHVTDEKGVQVHKCAQCDETFVCVQDLNKHIKTHPGMCRYQCPHCPKKYMQSSGLSVHVTREHKKVRLECKECGELFVYRHMYLDHLTKHEGKPKYLCPDCGKRFFHYMSWYDHKKRSCPMLAEKKPRTRKKTA